MNPAPTNDGQQPGRRRPTPGHVVARRVEEILRIRLDGAEFWDVREDVRENEHEAGSVWELPEDAKPLSDSQLWRYMAKADKLIAESCRAPRKKLLRRHLAQRRNLYAKAVNQGDVRAALACVDSEARLLDLFPDKDSVPPSGPGVVIIGGVDADAALGRTPTPENASGPDSPAV
ncbi:MAG TPA: hypothetical protein VMS17_17780 [Gemmataceae bacterium]|nr:hypothetical protein [Gemmataceae bacterium]